MARLKKCQDAYGQAMHDYYHGGDGYEVIERDDGYFGVSSGPPMYLAEYKDWPPHQKRAIERARGRVLDVGCGAGRVALRLQDKGLDVLGVDISPLAVEVCRKRGLKRAKVLSATQISRRLGEFDTIVMFGSARIQSPDAAEAHLQSVLSELGKTREKDLGAVDRERLEQAQRQVRSSI